MRMMRIVRLALLGLMGVSASGVAAAPDAACPSTGRVQSGPTPFDQTAREAQVASGDQRIAPLAPEEMSDEARKIADDLKAFFGAREPGLPKTFTTMFKHPGLYRGQMQLGLELNQRGAIPPRERELAILRTAWLVRSPFEWGEHVAYGRKLGLTVEELMGDHAVSDPTWAILSKSWTEQQRIELPGLVGSYTLTAMLYNTLRFGLLPGNPGFKAR
jgi:4-carboxymuconolactone decarboxylase